MYEKELNHARSAIKCRNPLLALSALDELDAAINGKKIVDLSSPIMEESKSVENNSSEVKVAAE